MISTFCAKWLYVGIIAGVLALAICCCAVVGSKASSGARFSVRRSGPRLRQSELTTTLIDDSNGYPQGLCVCVCVFLHVSWLDSPLPSRDSLYAVLLCSCAPVLLCSCAPVLLCSCAPVLLCSCATSCLLLSAALALRAVGATGGSLNYMPREQQPSTWVSRQQVATAHRLLLVSNDV